MNNLAKLNWVVLCKWPGPGCHEPIAAFNSPRIADAYADDCRRAKPPDWSYGVVRVNANGRLSEDQKKGR